MADIDEIIDYIKTLKKGFDKHIYESKIEELAYVASNTGLADEDFHTLFKIWLNLNIPITKWTSLGSCIVPQEKVGPNTVEYALRWLLANHFNQNFYPRMCFLLDWLTAAMDCDCIDMKALDTGYEIFYTFLTSEVLTPHVVKLIYVLTKPFDVTRQRVLELLEQAKKREIKKNLLHQLQVVIGLFKTYKPECVPEDVPSISIHKTFKKINVNLLQRFQSCQSRRNTQNKGNQRLLWENPFNIRNGSKKAAPLIPTMEFLNVGSTQYNNRGPQKTYLDFTDAPSLLQYSLNHKMSRPARLRTLLANCTGHIVLSLEPHHYTLLMHDLHHVLNDIFLGATAHSYEEKMSFLHQLAMFQSTLMQGLPVVTKFLSQLLPFWNERDYYEQILSLLEWLNVENTELISDILDVITKIYCRSHPIQQCLLVRCISNLYTNLVYSSTRSAQYFVSTKPSDEKFAEAITIVATSVNDMCNKGLQVNPEDVRVLYSSVRAIVTCARGAGAVTSPAAPLPLALLLLTNSALLRDMLAEALITYKKTLSAYKAQNGKDHLYSQQKNVLTRYSVDFVNCFSEQFISDRDEGIVFRRLPTLLVNKLTNLIPDIDKKLSLNQHLAFAPYTYMSIQANEDAVYEEYSFLNEFATKANIK